MPTLIQIPFKLFIKFILPVAFAVVLVSCGGSGGSSTETLSGTAATGIAVDGVANAYGSNGGEILNVPISVTGTYSIDVTGLTPPFYLSAVPNNNGLATQYSFSQQAGTANITPLTTLMLFYANGQQNPAGLITTWPTVSANVVAAATTAQATVNANFISQFSSIDFTNYDFLTTSFSIGDALDQILDVLGIDVSSGTPVITVNGTSFAFDPNIDITGVDIGGTGGGNTGGGSGNLGQLGIAGLDPSTFVATSFVTTNTAISWTDANNVSVVIGLLGGNVVAVSVNKGVDVWTAISVGANNLVGANFSGTSLTLTNLVVNSGSAAPLTLNGAVTTDPF